MTNPASTSLLTGLIGAGIQKSLSPALHEAEGLACGRRPIYRLIDLVELGLDASALPDLLRAAEWMGFTGLNITHPCKQAVLPYLHDLSDEARAIGAVNTVVLRGGKRVGHNTDCSGFAEGVRRFLPGVALGHAVQLGAGGAGAAVAHALLGLGVEKLSVFDTEMSRAALLAASLCARFGAGRALAESDLEAAMREADGLVQCTPIGMAKYPGMPIPASYLRPAHWVAEIIYFPLETELLRTARVLGCRTLDGSAMAVFQAAEAFRLFSGVTPDAERMLRHMRLLTGASGPPVA